MPRKTVTTKTPPVRATAPIAPMPLRGRTRRGQGEAGLDLSNQRVSDNFEDRGRGSRYTINIETRPRPRRAPGAVIGTDVGQRRTRTRVAIP